jgi:hypothetical protein
MKSDGSVHKRSWVPPKVTKLAIGTHTKSTVAVDHGLEAGGASSGSNSVAEPQPHRQPATKFGFSFEWSFPLSVRTD